MQHPNKDFIAEAIADYEAMLGLVTGNMSPNDIDHGECLELSFDASDLGEENSFFPVHNNDDEDVVEDERFCVFLHLITPLLRRQPRCSSRSGSHRLCRHQYRFPQFQGRCRC